jgi:hypothetical protein
VSVDKVPTGSGRFPGRRHVSSDPWGEAGDAGRVRDLWSAHRRCLIPRGALPSDPLAQETALFRGAPVLVHPVPHRAPMPGRSCLLDPIGILLGSPGVLVPHNERLLDRHLAILYVGYQTEPRLVPSLLSHGHISFRTMQHSS